MSKIKQYRDEIFQELPLAYRPNDKTKDILIVVHNQLDYVRKCIESVVENTTNYRLYVWDNGSNEETERYLSLHPAIHHYMRSEENRGFILPNNLLALETESPYLIFLNSDTEVKPGWDLAMINYLEDNIGYVAQVGYCGSKLDHEGKGGQAAYGEDADFICGWCFCISRQTYFRYGLFDDVNLEFAYGEDSDLSLRLRDAGEGIYSLHLDLVVHHGNKTIEQVHRELGDYVKGTFERNHEYIRRRWFSYIGKD